MNIGKSIFYEKINITKLNYIINNPDQYDSIIKEQEKDMRRTDKNYNAYAVFRKIMNEVIIPEELRNTEYGIIPVQYKKGRNSNGIGRWYANNGIGIQPLCCCVRHTICDGIWVDIDQVNSHPTIFKHLMDKYNFKSSLLDECLNNREEFLKKVMNDEKCSRDIAKTLVIAIINGAKYTSPTLKSLSNQLKPVIEYVNSLPEYNDIVEFVKKTYKDDKNINGKIISRVLQIIENQLLELYLEFFNSKRLIINNQVALIFDGFQLHINDNINQDLLNECRKYAFDKTGYDIELKIKPFDNCLKLPDNYSVIEDLQTSIINKYKCIDNYDVSYIDTAINSEGAHIDVANAFKTVIKDAIAYDDNIKKWYVCNKNNIWIESPSGIIVKSLLTNIMCKKFLDRALYYSKLGNKLEDTEDNKLLKEKYDKIAVEALKITQKLKTNSYLNHVIECCKCCFLQDKFFETKLDSNIHLLAFNDKCLDCKGKVIRNIEPKDYISITTGYNYPIYKDEECEEIINNYYNTIYPDEAVREYMWNNNSLTLNGEKMFQTFNIHSGKGCNSKSTAFSMLRKILGRYYVELNANTFTKQSKSPNATSELYTAKGARLVVFNEPDNDTENKLQVSIIKPLVENSNGKMRTRCLHTNSIEITISFRIEFSCNNKPTLSSVDGGIGRRIRNIHYPVQFVAEPDPNNKHQALLDLDMCNKLTTDGIRDTYILMLIDRFINISSKLTTEIIPDQIKQDSNEYIEDCNPVLGFIMEKYTITNNEKDRIQSSVIFNDFKIKTSSKMLASKFKDDMLGISGITHTKTKGIQYFRGLKEKVEGVVDE
jgi:hypothetical protein